MTLLELIESSAQQLDAANVSFGHGTTNAKDEAAWLVLWCLGLPLDTPLDDVADGENSEANRPLALAATARVATLLEARISTRKPAAYLTKEAWLQGMAFYVDERCIVPRSLIAELLVDGGMDYWLTESTHRVLDLCTGNGSLAVIAATVFPEVQVTASDLSTDALAVARINVDKHGLQDRITLLESDALAAPALQARGPFDLILCNPPYVNAQSMANLPLEYQAEPVLALAGGSDGMDFIRTLFNQAPTHMASGSVLVLEIGNERDFFEAAFPTLDAVWLETSAGEDQVLLVTLEDLITLLRGPNPDGLGK
jgi:ribosomal protein L3 glutamine methyltransferase